MGERLGIIRLQPSSVLDWWGFGGAGADVLHGAYPHARRVVVEPTAALAARSTKDARQPWWSPRRWTVGGEVEVVRESEASLSPAQLVWSNMMLHVAQDPPALFERWHRALVVDGFVMFSCLGPGTLRELVSMYERLGWGAPTQDFVDMHDLGDMLVHAGFADPVMDQETLHLQWASPQDMLAELRGLGCNAAPDRMAGLRTPRWRDHWLAQANMLRGPEGRIGLRFEVVYGHAFKAAPRLRQDQATVVSVDDMRAMIKSGRT